MLVQTTSVMHFLNIGLWHSHALWLASTFQTTTCNIVSSRIHTMSQDPLLCTGCVKLAKDYDRQWGTLHSQAVKNTSAKRYYAHSVHRLVLQLILQLPRDWIKYAQCFLITSQALSSSKISLRHSTDHSHLASELFLQSHSHCIEEC